MSSNKRLNATLTLGGAVASSLKSAFGFTKSSLQGINKEIDTLNKRQKLLGRGIGEIGKMGGNIDGLRRSYAAVTTEIDRARRAQARLQSAARIHAKAVGVRNVGAAAAAGGAIMGATLMPGLREGKHYQSEVARLEALGMGAKVNQDAIAYAKNLKAYGISQLDKLEITRDALSIFGDLHHAENAVPTLATMKFANKAVYGEAKGEENSKSFFDMLKVIELRNGTNSKEDFDKQANMVQKVLSGSGNRVGPTEWRNLIATGGIAAKGMRDDAFYYQMEHLVQEQGGDRTGTGLSAAYSNLYQGRTSVRAARNLEKFGLIGDPSKVKNDKSGQLSYLNPGALKGAELFRQSQFEWMRDILIPTLATKGVTTKDQVLDAIGMIFTNKNAAAQFSTMYLQKDQIEKSEKVNRGAADIATLDKIGRQQVAGKELELRAKVADLELKLGTTILPLYAKGLELVTAGVEKFAAFTEKNPKLVAGLVAAFAGIGTALAVVGPALITVAAGMYAWAAAGPVVMGAIGVIGGLVAAVFTPVGLAVAGLAIAFGGAAALIIKYWDPIKTYFSNWFATVKATFTNEMKWIAEKIEWVSSKWQAAKDFIGAGSNQPTGGAGPRPLPQMKSFQPGGGGQVNHFQITQQPGESGEDLARRLAKEFDKRRGVQNRSSMVDGVMQ